VEPAPARTKPDLRLLTAVFCGGMLGALARAGLAQALPHDPTQWPWATFAVNLVGAFVLGWATTRLPLRPPRSPYLLPLVGPGFCGALTTFSTLELELLRMLDAGAVGLAVGYAAASYGAGIALARTAQALARRETTA
jgi:fluoride exporter